MPSDLGKLLIRFGVDVKDVERAEAQVKQSMGGISQHAHRARNALMGLAGAAGFAGLGYTVVNLAKGFMGFEDAMNQVKAVAGATGDEFDKLTKMARELSTTTEYSTTQIAGGMYELSSAGMSANDQLKVMPAVLDLATAGQLDMSDAAATVVKTLAGFKLQGDQAIHVTDVLAESVNKSMLHFEDFAVSMQYVAPIAGATNQSLEDMVAALALMSNAGLRAEKSGTTLNAAFVRLMNPTDEITNGLKKMGLTIDQVNPATHKFSEMLRALRDGTAKLTDAEKQQALAMIFGTETLTGMLALVNAGPDALDELSASFGNSDGAARETAATMRESLSKELQSLKNNLIDAVYPAFEGLKPKIEGLIAKIKEWADSGKIEEWSTSAVKFVGDAGNVIGDLLGLVNSIVGAFGGWKSSLEALAAAWVTYKVVTWAGTLTSIGAGASTAAAGVGAIGVAAKTALGPVAMIAAALGFLAVTDYNKNKKEGESFAEYEARQATKTGPFGLGAPRALQDAREKQAQQDADKRRAEREQAEKDAADATRRTQERQQQLTAEFKALGATSDEVVARTNEAIAILQGQALAAAQSFGPLPDLVVQALQSGVPDIYQTGIEGIGAYVQGIAAMAGYPPDQAADIARRVREGLRSEDEGTRADALKMLDGLLQTLVSSGAMTAEQAATVESQIAVNLDIQRADIPGTYAAMMQGIFDEIRNKGAEAIQKARETRQQIEKELKGENSPDISYKVPKIYEKMFSNLEGVFASNMPNLGNLIDSAMPAMTAADVGGGGGSVNNNLYLTVQCTGFMDQRALDDLGGRLQNEVFPRLDFGRVKR